MMVEDVTGKRYGRLVAKSFHSQTNAGASRWLFMCDCGTEKLITLQNAKNGHTKSCGCWKREEPRGNTRNRKHGLATHLPIYVVWSGMMGRCYNSAHPSYDRYGASGVTVCARWHDVTKFYEDMGERPKGTTLDRLDNSKGYDPENCRWATAIEQANNKTTNVVIEYHGQSKTLAEWERLFGWKAGTLTGRRYRGWSVEEMLTIPPRTRRRNESAEAA